MAVFSKRRLSRGRLILISMLFGEVLVESFSAGVILYIKQNYDIISYIIGSLPRITISIILYYYLDRGKIIARYAQIFFLSFVVVVLLSTANINKGTLDVSLIFQSIGITAAMTSILVMIFSSDLRHYFDYRRLSIDGRRKTPLNSSFSYDVAISFAGEDRRFARKLADLLVEDGVSVFYDDYEAGDLVGKDLYQLFQKKYRDSSMYCAVVISRSYIEKKWTRHELKQAQARDFRQVEREYIIPIRLDDVDVPGLNETIGFIDGRKGAKHVSKIISEKVKSNLM